MPEILIISDVENREFLEYNKDLLEGIDFIVSCGDLPVEYLRWIRRTVGKPLYYLCGNYIKNPVFKPRDITYIGGRVVRDSGLTIAGIDGIWQQNSREMIKASDKLEGYKGDIDILVTHAPSEGMGDGTRNHAGAPCFIPLYRKKNIKLHLYGHNHLSYGGKRYLEYNDTKLYNAYDHFIVNV